MFSRIAIVNRGEAAMRLIHAVRDLNAAAGPGQPRIETVALHTTGERRAMFVREADLAYDLGPAAGRPYLDYAVLERALLETGADAAWAGWGFVAEDPAFAELCERAGVTFIGPSAQAMRTLGDKIGSKLIAEEAGVPVAPWSGGGVATLEEATAAARRIGYPLMLKATAGGGGRGIRKVTSDAELAGAYQRTRDEAERAFGSGVVFLEKLITGARHVEVQIIADGAGTAWAIGVRDCSVQRRNQKVIEESRSPVMTSEQARILKDSAERLALAVGYCGAGTVEFLFDPRAGTFSFLEVNTRLQVEHPITEVTTGTDLVRLQLHVAAGGTLAGERPAETGHAVEARLNAEDADRDFAPAPGRIALLTLPSGPGIRVDTGVGTGDEIPADFDSMIAKIIASGSTREEALARLRRALHETTVVIDGGTTNKSFVLDLLDATEVISGEADTGWIDRARAQGRLSTRRHSGIALVAAGIEAYEAQEEIERQRLITTAHGGRPQVQHEMGRPVELALRGATYEVTVLRTGPDRFRVTICGGGDGGTVDARIDRIDAYTSRISAGGRTYRLVTAAHGPVQLVEVDGVTHRVSRDSGGVLRSPAPALVVAVPAPAGAEVAAGEPVLVLESMKMETVVPAPFPARVRELLVSVGSRVETGAALVRLEPLGDGVPRETTGDGTDLELPSQSVPAGPLARARAQRAGLSAMVLGYDVDPADDGRAVTGAYLAGRAEALACGDDAPAGEAAVLELFTDITELTRNRPSSGEDAELTSSVHSPREHFHTYLRSFDPDRGSLPESFRAKLTRVLRHYGVAELTRTRELEQAVFRLFLAQQRSGPDIRLVTGILQQWLADPVPYEPGREVLDRLIAATQLRHPVIGDLARSVRFHWFDQPIVAAEREQDLAGVAEELAALAVLPPGPERDERTGRLAAIPEQLVRFVPGRLAGERGRAADPLLEVLTRRHYGPFGLHDLLLSAEAGHAFAQAWYVQDGTGRYVVATMGRFDDLTPAGPLTGALAARLAAGASPGQAAADVYLHWPGMPASAEEASAELAARLAPLAPLARRISVAAVTGEGQAAACFTFRPGPEGTLAEDCLVRGVHPMVGRRLDLWRLREFDVTRLPSAPDVLLYHCVAPGNPADQRLVALALVHRLSIVYDDEGRVAGLPHVERAMANCLDAIRRARAERPGASLDLNYVWVHIWPDIEADVSQLTALKDGLAPLTFNAGLEEVIVSGQVAFPLGTVAIAGRFTYQQGAGVVATLGDPPAEPLRPLDDYTRKVVTARRRGLVYPYELTRLIAGPRGRATEYDLDGNGVLVPVDRPAGQNTCGMITAVVSTPSRRYPEGVTRVLLCGDPLRALGSLGEAECSRVIAALDLAEQMGVPVEWFALSSGARISMTSGTENMDAVARALRRIVGFTQAGGEINIVVAGINVGAQPYWNAEATMLMHTRGILVMTPDSAMVLTGKQSLDFSGGVSAEDNFGIGGYDRVMGPNGQAQYWAPDLAHAVRILRAHYEHSYVVPGEAGPRRAPTSDPFDRDITAYPHDPALSGFATVGDIFSAASNPDRKKAFDIRTVMAALADADHRTLERWAGAADAGTSVVYDAHIGGIPVCLIGIESKPVERTGFWPADGPDSYTAGTLFPRSSKKTARAINAASGNRPVVVLANLSGFDGSPESMRNLQLEYGAEIGRAIVNVRGPIVFCVISRYHGGAFVVFSKALNPQMTVLALEGSFASVIGGAPAAAVVFSREVDKRTLSDPRVGELEGALARATDAQRPALVSELAEVRREVRSEKLGEVAAEFDAVHSIHRAVEVGSVDEVIAAADLRPKVISTLERALGLAG